MDTLLPVAAVVLFGAFAQGYAGFGFGLIAVPMLALFLPATTVIPLVALCGMIINTMLYVQLRGKSHRPSLVALLVGALLGAGPGIYLLHHADESMIRAILSFVLIGYATWRLAMKPLHLNPGGVWGILAGALSGMLGTGMSTNGPPAILYVTLHNWGKEVTKATLTSYLFYAGIVVIVAHAVSGATTDVVIDQFLVAIPLVIFGTGVGAALFSRSGDRSYEKAIYGLILCMGIVIFPWGALR